MNKNNNTYILIMAGGVGSRFWPRSRNHFPKQFIDIVGVGKSLLQLTYERFLKICEKEHIYILSNEQYKDLVLSQLPGLDMDRVLLEPSRNNTAPCIAYASYKILKINPDANIVVAPSDHLILKEPEFLNKIELALSFAASNDALLTLGIQPTRADTGYGYINYQPSSINSLGNNVSEFKKVKSFMEKPSLDKAKEYLASGTYLWNAGIFIWSVNSIKNAFKKYAPEIDSLFNDGYVFYNTPHEKQFIIDNYSDAPNISIDYAVMEKAENVYTIPADIGWSDLGTWTSIHDIVKKDENQNSVDVNHLKLINTSNCIIRLPSGKGAVIKGIDDYIIVDDGKVLLIYPKSDEQEIRQIAVQMVQDYGPSYL